MAYRCLNHPERDAIGICVKCRKYICAECATRISGVNYCADCLPRAGAEDTRRSLSWEKPVAAILMVLSLLVCSFIIGVFAVLFEPVEAVADIQAVPVQVPASLASLPFRPDFSEMELTGRRLLVFSLLV